ncbi:uncharacterized protein UDID_19284 [Ustilago sp. UG-2017a]|nr:uncharacterized protein UDID_19284 [Ustilago sp. UG-2017a]
MVSMETALRLCLLLVPAKSLASPRPHLDHGLPWLTLLWIGLIPNTYAPTIQTNNLLATCAFRPMTQSLNTQKLSKLERYLAARWSAKEAAYKALYPRHGFSWKDLSVQKPGINVDNAVPIVSIDLAQLKLQGFCTKKTEHSLSDGWRSKHSVMSSIPKQHLSLSHDGEYVAFRMLVSKEPHRMNIDKLKGLVTKDQWNALDREGVLKITIQGDTEG